MQVHVSIFTQNIPEGVPSQYFKLGIECCTGKNFENPYKVIVWKLYGPLLEINRMDEKKFFWWKIFFSFWETGSKSRNFL